MEVLAGRSDRVPGTRRAGSSAGSRWDDGAVALRRLKPRDTRLDRIVAVKISHAQFSDGFAREARATAALNHPHIATLCDVGPDYLVMEFVEGETLRGPLPLARALLYAGQTLDALEAAHRKGIKHRDLKPANVKVSKSGVKLLDFGLAQVKAPATAADQTTTMALSTEGTIAGTLHVARATAGQGGRRSQRHLRVRADLVRIADGTTGIRWRQRRERYFRHHDSGAARPTPTLHPTEFCR
jgi:serine/threonine protein kinase